MRNRKKILTGSVEGADAGRGNVEKPAPKRKPPAKKKVASAPRTIFRDIALGDAPAGLPCVGEFRPEAWGETHRIKVAEYPLAAFALRVLGHSMTGRGISDGDILVFAVPDDHEPIAGDVVAVCIDGEVTIKTLVRRNGKTTLKAENPDYPDPVFTENSAIQGVRLQKVPTRAGRGQKNASR